MEAYRTSAGLRVRDEFLGEGVIVEVLGYFKASVMVRFDETPPFDYNGGSNPCLRFVETMEPIGSAGAAREEGEG